MHLAIFGARLEAHTTHCLKVIGSTPAEDEPCVNVPIMLRRLNMPLGIVVPGWVEL